MNVIATQVMRVIERCARANEPCPTSREIAEEIGVSNVTVMNYINGLEDAGVITVERGARTRVITIVSTGLRTAGTITKLHWRNKAERPANWSREECDRRARELAAARLAKEEKVASLYVQRDPCIRCGVPAHRHDEFGCRRYRA